MYGTAFLTIPTCVVLALVPHVVRGYFVRLSKGGYDLKNPRQSVQKAMDSTPKYAGIISRCSAAHYNQLEGLPIFAASILMAVYAGVDSETVNSVALFYTGCRIAFNYFYISGTTWWKAFARSASWTIGMFGCLYLMVKASVLVQVVRS